jgi:hypothetical protein
MTTTFQAPSIGCYYTEVTNIFNDLTSTHRSEMMSHVIGCDGRVLKAIHRRFPGCLYIWYNNDSGVFEVNSTSHYINMKVRKALIERMDHIYFQFLDYLLAQYM